MTTDTTTHDQKITLAVSSNFKVDRKNGILRDLSLMKSGREAKGHGLYIDQRTLQTALAVVAESGGLLKAYYTHDHVGSAIPFGSQLYDPASELRIPGFFSGLKIEDGQLVAEKFELYETFRKHHAEEAEQIMEMAEKTPQLLALSVEIWGYTVFTSADGAEYSERPDDVDLLHDGMPVLRITELFAAAFVADGAATDGLFAKMGRRLFGPAAPDQRLQDLAAALSAFAQSPAGHSALVAFAATGKDGSNQNTTDTTNMTNTSEAPSALAADHTLLILTSLNSKYGNDAASFREATNLFLANPGQSLDQIEATLAAQQRETELVNLRTQVGALTAELDAALAERDAAAAERDEFKLRFESIRQSGYISSADAQSLGVDLGLPASGESGQDNPWAPGRINFTRQAEIIRTDPALAATLSSAVK
jgi:hypothetical protein